MRMVLIGRKALALALAAICLPAGPAAALSNEERRPWMADRHAGAPLEDAPPPPISGWRVGPALTFPYTLGMGAAYLYPGTLTSYRFGGSWGMAADEGVIGLGLRDLRVYGSLLYYLLPGSLNGGPYVETGLDLMRSSRPVLAVNWPVIPHIGFGTMGRLGETFGWDVTFTAAGNGLLTLEGGMWF